MLVAAAAILPNPKIAATMATIKNMIAQRNIYASTPFALVCTSAQKLPSQFVASSIVSSASSADSSVAS
ncbi:MAG: hypothetical protein ACOCVL_00345, partial [Candidatus Sumerlaeota bacterium]